MDWIEVSKIRYNRNANVNWKKVNAHRTALQTDDLFPIDVRPLGDGTYVIDGNGRHRLHAYLLEGFSTVPCNVR